MGNLTYIKCVSPVPLLFMKINNLKIYYNIVTFLMKEEFRMNSIEVYLHNTDTRGLVKYEETYNQVHYTYTDTE